jgi:hypothetical protein
LIIPLLSSLHANHGHSRIRLYLAIMLFGNLLAYYMWLEWMAEGKMLGSRCSEIKSPFRNGSIAGI